MMPLWMRASLRPRRRGAGARSGRWARRAWPSGCADAGRRRRQRVGPELGRQVRELARLLAGLDVVAVEQRHAGRVVAAVLEAGEALHDDVECRPVVRAPDVSHDSTHEGQPRGDRVGPLRHGGPRVRKNGARVGAHQRTRRERGERRRHQQRQQRLPPVALRRVRPGRVVPVAREPPLNLDDADLARLRGLGDRIDLREVEEVYLRSRACSILRRRDPPAAPGDERLPRRAPGAHAFVIGVAVSVAVGKSTTARILREMLARWPDTPRVALVTTDGFLWPNAELERRGLLQRKGSPESYDRISLLRSSRDQVWQARGVSAPSTHT